MRAGQAFASAAAVAVTLALAGCQSGGLGRQPARRAQPRPTNSWCCRPSRWRCPRTSPRCRRRSPARSNRVDFDPHSEAIAGLTGRPAAAGNADGAALVARAGPRDPSIRAQLAAEDVTWRQTHHGLLLERWFTRDPTALVYQSMVLDAPAEFERMRARGVQVPAPPPSALDQ